MSTTDSPPTSPDSLKNPSKPDWKISELYEKSWGIVKKNRVLWIFGMAVGIGSGGANFNSNLDTDSIERILNKEKETASILPNVLGEATDKGSQFFSQLISAIPVPILLVIGLELLIIVVAGIIISFVYGAWANAALIQGIQNAINVRAVSIRDCSEKAFGSIKSLIWLEIITFLILLGAVFAFMIPILLVVAINNTALTVIMVLLAILSIIPLILLFALTMIWAPLIVILDGKPAWESLKTGFALAKKKFWPMLGLGIVNSILAFFVVGIPFVVLVGVVVGIIWGATQATNLTLVLAPLAAVLVLVALVGFILLSGIVTAFKASVWTIAYNAIRGKYDN